MFYAVAVFSSPYPPPPRGVGRILDDDDLRKFGRAVLYLVVSAGGAPAGARGLGLFPLLHHALKNLLVTVVELDASRSTLGLQGLGECCGTAPGRTGGR